ncbi:hypothetical protein TWF970_007289 [Orbilia oligospora]|uniref:VWFA domain-containing protein n=1 Tax=Orbilia oligospora TaxID=2813651 RepID=A0A7C8VM29_ORBOL|nr:hypothetical protein TWF970_007289 [Orbilia oligospora]
MQRIDGYTCCGIYYIPAGTYTPQPLPLLNLTTEITLTPTYSRTVLKQHFKNPSITEAISEANYVFPLHTTQTITSFTCHVGEDKVLNGIVQSKPKAKATYDAAVSRGETAGLLSSADSDVWQTKLGNVPAGTSIEVVITCVAQLQHDSERDAIRFNLPTYIASRYGAPPQEILNGDVSYSYRVGKLGWGSWTVLRGTDKWVDVDGGMSIKVFVEMDSPIKMVEAPAHATRLSMGTHSASDSSEAFDPKKALLTLSAKTTSLDKDFVVLVKTARSGHPSAVVQRHPTKDTASMMVTLVPKFNMPVARPEVVFICDRSGSMSGNETQLRKALAVFLQSLPVGCKFNICSFGSSHSFLWSKSKTYSEETLKEAQKHVAGFEADMGGTEMFPPVKAAVERRYKDVNLELLLLTDGDIWQRDQLMDYVREQCKGKTVRMFTLGIGNGISHALIDGLATVGGGYSQVVQLEEKLDSKVVRMLRAALGQHVSDYTLELSGSTTTTTSDEDEYDMLGDAEPEKVIISGKKEREPTPEPKKISLFDTSAELDPPPEYESKDTDEARWAHLPPLPKLPAKIQSPNVIPPLFSFSRTNAYVVFTPCPKTFPKVAKLQAKTITGDILELEIPILKIDDGKDVSQLAARSFLQELENGTGYLHEGLLSAEGITKDKQESKWDEIIEREGVRWGEGFEVASKWTSFVAIEDKPGNVVEEEETIKVATDEAEGSERSRFSRRKMSPTGMASNPSSALRPKAYNATNDLADTATGYRRGGSMKKKSIAPSFGFSALTRSAKSAVQNQGGLMGSTGSELMDFDFDSFLQESDQNTYGPGFAYSSPGGITPYDSCLASSEYSTFHGGFSSIKEHGRVGFHPIYLVSSLGSPVYNPTSPGYTPTSPSYHPTSPPSISKSPPYTGFYPPVRSGVQHSVAFPQFSPKSPNYSPASPCYSPTSPVSTPKATPYGEAQGPEIAQTSSSDQKRKRRLADNGDQDDAVSRNANIWKFNNVTSMFGSSSAPPPPARESSIAASYVPPPIRAAAAPGLGKPQIPMPSSSFYAPPHKSQDNDEEENLEAEIDTQLAQIGNEVFRLSYLAHSIDQEVEKQNRSIDRYDDKIAKLLDESEHCGTDKRQIVYSASRQKSSAPMPPGGSAMYESPKELKKERSASSSIMKKSAKSFARRSASPGFAKASAPAPQSLSGDMGDEEDDEDMGCDFLEESRSSVRAGTPVAVGTAEERIHGLIMLQSFAGSFSTSDKLASIVAASFKGAPASDVLKKLKELAQTLGVKEEIVATWAAILVFEKGEGHAAERDTWELVVEKAVMWVEGEGSGDDVKEKVRDVIGA